jgi:hypothetical protein
MSDKRRGGAKMRSYSWQKINEMVQPLMQMMEADYPIDAQLVITAGFAKIEFVHEDMNFMGRGNHGQTIGVDAET